MFFYVFFIFFASVFNPIPVFV